MAKRKKTVMAGDYVRAVLYTAPEPRDGIRARAEKSKITTAARKKMNDRMSKNNLEARIYGNFILDDLFVTLTYRPADQVYKWAEAVKCATRFVDNLRRHRKKNGQELKYIYTTEYKHGDGLLHHHFILNAVGNDIAVIRALWAYGDQVDVQLLRKYGLAYGEILADYMMKERKPVGARAWTGSMNLIKPKVKSEFVHVSATLDPPPGAIIIEREEYATVYGSYSYIKYILTNKRKYTGLLASDSYLDSGQDVTVSGL